MLNDPLRVGQDEVQCIVQPNGPKYIVLAIIAIGVWQVLPIHQWRPGERPGGKPLKFPLVSLHLKNYFCPIIGLVVNV